MAVARDLARWAAGFEPEPDDLALAGLALADTVAVAMAARDHPLRAIAAPLPDAARWAAMAHVLDFDDLHIETTTHISVVTVPAVLAAGGDARAYLAGAGAMARIGAMLGWGHYAAGWHATCTAGAPAAAVAAGVALGLDAERLATAMALAVPAAGGVQDAFGTQGKSLQVGFAAEAGVWAALLAEAGAGAEPQALDAWLKCVGGVPAADFPAAPAVPGGLAVKLFPCCYAMQRPIATLREVRERLRGEIDFASFTDAAVLRPEARRLIDRVRVDAPPGESRTLLDGSVTLHIEMEDGSAVHTESALPPGAPGRRLSAADLRAKAAACGPDVPALLSGLTWARAADLMRGTFPGDRRVREV